MVLSLPPIPPELKSIAPYLQRADETASADPVISYWCAYYAAQQGIALKVKDSAARHFLFDLLGLLEKIKSDIGPNDAVHDEPASAAYVENFALRVFAGADNEDRNGNITKNTARKFLAAANFLEILRTFDAEKTTIDLPDIEAKIKYAKWKAADIAKAFREGRRPTPGPAASAAGSQDELLAPLPDVPVPDLNVVPPTTPPAANTPLSSHSSPPSITRSHPPPPNLADAPPTDHLGPHLPDGLAPPQPPQSPGSWSTTATPGTPGFQRDDATSSSVASSHSPPVSGGVARTAFVSGELEGKTEDEIDAEAPSPTSAAKSVHFSPSTVGGFGAPAAPFTNPPPYPPPSAPSFSPPSPPASGGYPSPSNRSTRLPVPPAASPHIPSSSYPHAHSVPLATSPVPDTTVTTLPVELSPQVIARAQKHCKFAISALDYEDREQAVKELRAALKMLGG
ncbi:Vta1 like-domain-containing protein [Dichomitus squalens]|uniref:Vta1 like-domain-containing protein n=1 Tax=Dichomitus squalens TaxID=114155 RepID=A0A4Q9Q828_9APHY|nr:Vta1 like-domain-containing protein [Dichomitus squalens]